MPERHFQVQWPDGLLETCYSPSSTIENYLSEGKKYPLKQFLDLSDQALNEASERVRQKYGYACSSAMDQLKKINNRALTYRNLNDPYVSILRIT